MTVSGKTFHTELEKFPWERENREKEAIEKKDATNVDYKDGDI